MKIVHSVKAWNSEKTALETLLRFSHTFWFRITFGLHWNVENVAEEMFVPRDLLNGGRAYKYGRTWNSFQTKRRSVLADLAI